MNAARIEVLAVRPGTIALSEAERGALSTMAERLGGTAAGDPREAEASLLLKLLLVHRCGGREVRRTEKGKPFIPQAPFCWSLAHDAALACVAVAPVAVGIDVEPLVPVRPTMIAALQRAAPSSWTAWVQAASGTAEQASRFARAWTALEASRKAEGTGFGEDGRGVCGAVGPWHYDTVFAWGCAITSACAMDLAMEVRLLDRSDFDPCLQELRQRCGKLAV